MLECQWKIQKGFEAYNIFLWSIPMPLNALKYIPAEILNNQWKVMKPSEHNSFIYSKSE